jgi:tetratricopeptide (TPR) repeat protein
MDGRRIAPRHIMIELDGRETYDVYFAWDTASVFSTIREGIENRPDTEIPIVRGDRPVLERVKSRHIADRVAVEEAYREGDEQLRRQLLEAALANPGAAPVDLLRLSIFGLDTELAALARDALAKVEDSSAVDLIGEALAVNMGSGQREELVAALERISSDSPRARLLANVHRGLDTESRRVNVQSWSQAMQGGGTYAPPPSRDELEARIEANERAVDADAVTKADAQLEIAEASLALAVDPDTRESLASDPRNGPRLSRLMFEDARREALEAQSMGAAGWRLEALLGLTAWYLGDKDQAFEHAVSAMETMPANPESWTAVATLALFAQARQEAIWDAMRNKKDWPREWMTDVNSAYAVLARHPLGTDQHAVTHYDFLQSLGAKGRAARVLDESLSRFPDSWKLHDRLRERILAERGVEGLEAAYEAMLAEEGASSNLHWHAGLTSIVAAEFHRRAGDLDAAEAAYDRALTHYDRAIDANPESRDSSDHYAAMAIAGKARIALEKNDLDTALELVLAGIARHPEATDDLDGLNITPSMTANTLRARLAQAERTEQVARLDQALAELDPRLLEPPEYERATRPPQRGRRGRRGR